MADRTRRSLAGRTKSRPHQIQRLQNHPARRPLELHGRGRRRLGTGSQRFHDRNKRRKDQTGLCADPDSRHPRRGRTPAGIPRHDENPLLFVRIRHIGHHIRQIGLQTGSRRNRHRPGAGNFGRQEYENRPGCRCRRTGPAAVRQTERQSISKDAKSVAAY